ncbi:MAG: DUF3488 and transglutaminase-like domain-containing protein [Thiobacillaceae bacterium]|nr:DUF3488 and transglutaminase-like domain-containing protein [Thiobacillaceae bacterium]
MTGGAGWRLDARLFWLLPPLLAGLPHASHFPPWLSALCAGLWLWRAALAAADRPLPVRWLRVVLALAAVALVFSQFGLFLGRQAGVPLLVLLVFVKLLETETPRQKRLALLLSYFVALSLFLFNQSLPITAYLLAVAWLITAALAQLQPLPSPDPRPGLITAARLMLAGLPLAVALFLFFPRLDRPLWLLPSGERVARAGLSDTMRPGDFGRLILSGEIAFRASFAGTPPDSRELYWRGPVLTRFDGRAWSAPPNPRPMGVAADGLDAPLRYSLTLEPHQRAWVFSLGLPAALPPQTRLLEGLQLVAEAPITQRRRFELTSHPRYRLGADPAELAEALRLPEGYNPRARDLAERWRAEAGQPGRLAERALAHFRQAFTYTLAPPTLGLHSVDEFLFDTRRGFCEHYASSFVFLMRAAGIPARVVTGYLGGEANPIDGHLVVRQSDAHAWAEIWLAEEGWVRMDPTASVSPLRLERGLTAALPAVELPAGLTRLHAPWLRDLRHAWEAMNNGWNQWVLGYNLDRQLRLLARLSPALADRAWLAAGAALLVGLALMTLLAWRGLPRAAPDPAARLYARFLARLARVGPRCEATEGAADFARRAGQQRPDLAAEIERVSALYLRARYAPDPAALAELGRAVARFRPRRGPR